MSDEIDDLSFPNAVITRLMNEAVRKFCFLIQSIL